MKFIYLISLVLLLPLISAYNVDMSISSNIADFNTDVYSCSNSGCASLVFYDSINSGTKINLYDLIGSGDKYYLEYDYKNCYAPHIYRNHVWDPYTNKEDFSIELNKKLECSAIIYDAETSEDEIELGQSITVEANIKSAFGYPTNLPTTISIPNDLVDEYSSQIRLELYADGILVDSRNEEILMGHNNSFELSWQPAQEGEYSLVVKTIVTDCACSSQLTQELFVGNLIVNEAECITNRVFGPWSNWQNLTGCRSDNTLLQKRTRTEYDANNCCDFANVTHEETRSISCINECITNRVFGPWSNWQNITGCRSDNTTLQKRTRIEYDLNNCGTFSNVTREETRNAGCVYHNITPSCYIDSDCGNSYCAGGPNYCSSGDVYQNFIFPRCINAGNVNAQCSYSLILPQLIQDCQYGCLFGSCLGEPDNDLDDDGYNNTVDCNDTNPNIHPGAIEICGNGIDEDCSGADSICDLNDTTPPLSITNLTALNIGKSWIYWTWTNPTNNDFSKVLLYLGGVNIANTSNNYFNATGLSEGTSYTLTVYTMDNSSNINWTAVSNTAKTLSTTTPEDDDDDHKDRKDNTQTFEPINYFSNKTSILTGSILVNGSGAIILAQKSEGKFDWTPLLAVLFFILILLLIFLIFRLV